MARYQFALKMLHASFDRERWLCPYCESRHSILLQRKYLLIQARKCHFCGLIFRAPTDKGADSRQYYEQEYDAEYATHLPDLDTLTNWKNNNFVQSRCDKHHRIKFLQQMHIKNGRLLDFGCAWGYGAYQYQQAGFDAEGFEIDRRRAAFGRDHLAITIHSDANMVRDAQPYSIILADHSLEHLPDPGVALRLFESITRPAATLIIFVPNAANLEARRMGVGMRGGAYIGETHTVAFTPEWFMRNLPRHGFIPQFYTPAGVHLTGDDYLADQHEIALVAVKT